MRFDKKATFIKRTKEEYDPTIGGMVYQTIEKNMSVSVRSLSTEQKIAIFGKVDFETLAIVIRGKGEAYDFVEYDNKKYVVINIERYRNKTGYIVGESKI